MEAAENNHLETVKYLIKAGALVDPKVAIVSLSFSPEEAFVHHFFLDRSWVEVHRQRGGGLACLGHEALARPWLLVVSLEWCSILAVSTLGQVLPLAT